jgi:hypothetical protein
VSSVGSPEVHTQNKDSITIKWLYISNSFTGDTDDKDDAEEYAVPVFLVVKKLCLVVFFRNVIYFIITQILKMIIIFEIEYL